MTSNSKVMTLNKNKHKTTKNTRKQTKIKKTMNIVGCEELGFYTNISHPSPHCTMWWEPPQTLKLT
jgi:hypothetical protein